MKFNGPEFQPERDGARLSVQFERIRSLMLDNQWRTLAEIADTTGDPAASVSAQLRHMRKPRFGSYRVERKHLGNGLYSYRVLDPIDDLI